MLNINYLLLLLLLSTYSYFSYKKVFHNRFITKEQWNQINKFIVDPTTTFEMRNKINQVLYVYYDDWSYLKAVEFKKRHRHKCEHISINELYTYSNMGLVSAIKKYNGKSSFIKYSEIYIRGELYKAITWLHPITSVSKNERLKKQNMTDFASLYKRKKLLHSKFFGCDEWLLEKLKIKNTFCDDISYKLGYHDDYQVIWNKINTLKPFEKHLLHTKIDYFFNKKESNKEIAEKFGYSEEHIRKTIAKAMKKVIPL